MRRKLIKQEAIEQIANSSVTTAERELVEAENVLAQALGKAHLSLHCFNESTVLYETLDDTFVHSGYEVKGDHISFHNIEELVVDHETKVAKRKTVLAEMIDAVLTDKGNKATELFSEYMGLYSFNEAKKTIIKANGDNDFESSDVEIKPKTKGKLGEKLSPFAKREAKKSRDDNSKFKKTSKGLNFEKNKDAFKKKLKAAGKKIEEAYAVAENVLHYVNYLQVGPVLAESVTQRDENGNIVNLRIPTVKVRNESRLQSYDWKTLNGKVKNLRENALVLHGDQNFCKAMSDLKRQNAFSDAQALQTVLENVVRAWPHVLYVTQDELAQVVAEALTIAGVTNYGDQDCAFMAEGVLRTAHANFQERVNQILHLASAPKCEGKTDPYIHFQQVAEGFFASVDEKFGLEQKVFADLYESLEGLYKTADRRGNDQLKKVTASYLNELADILNGKSKADVELAEEVANFVVNFIETNLDGESTWKPSNSAHVTVSGDHPDMEKKASTGYTPSKDFSPDWGDELPMIGQDDMNYKSGKHAKAARSNSWGNEAGKDTFPSLKNPYILKPFGDYSMKGEKGVDKDDSGGAYWTGSSDDTWPKMQNPYVPKHETGKTYKMNKGKEKDLVVDL